MTVGADNPRVHMWQEKGGLMAGGQVLLADTPSNLGSRPEDGGLIIGVESHAGPRSSYNISLGQLSCQRFLALAKSSLYWMSPVYGCSASEVPPETQFLLLSLPPDHASGGGGGAAAAQGTGGAESQGETYALLLPLIDGGAFRATLRPPREGLGGAEGLVLRIESGDDAVMADTWQTALFVCAGRDPFELVERGVAVAARLSGGAAPSRDKEVPPSLDLFGWCTWDAFYSRVSAAGIQEGLQSLIEGGSPPRFLIIDDGWQQTDVDPHYRAAAAASLVSGMGHVSSIAPLQRAAVEEAAADLLAGSDLRQREELIGLHELEEELLTPLAGAGAGGAAPALPPGDFRSLPTSPRRYWGESPGGLRTPPRHGAAAAGGFGPPRGAMTSPRPGLKTWGHPSATSLGASPRVLGGRPSSGDSLGAAADASGSGAGSGADRGSQASLGSWASPISGTPLRGGLSPHLRGGPYGNPFRTETPPAEASPGASPGSSPFRSFAAGGGGGGGGGGAHMMASPLRGPLAPPPTPEVLAKQLEEAAAVVVQGVAPLRTPSIAQRDLETLPPPSDVALGPAAAAAAGGAGEARAQEEQGPVLQPPKLGLWGRLLGLLRRAEVAVLHWVRSFLSAAPSSSWRMRAFSALARGPLRGSILRFYASATDHTRRLQSVKANTKFSHPEAGPEHPLSSFEGEDGLKLVVGHLKQQYGLQYVYCWHAMMGFWSGVAPGGEHTAKYAPRMVYPKPTPSILEVDPSYSWVQPVLAGVGLVDDPTQLHRDMHAYLKESGVDGVKVDVQGTVGLTGSAAGGAAALSGAYHASLEDSVAAHFPGNHCINCMCGSSEDLYRMSRTNLARVSDDFYPHIPASWTAHIAHCALNSLFCGELVIPDWDMFHSAHPAALLHATARAISGGPLYVSDRPGLHDFAVLSRLVLPDGSVLRCRRHARPTADCLLQDVLRDGETVLKLWNVNGYSGVVGVFNIQGSAWSIAHRGFVTHDHEPRELMASLAPADVAALAHAEAYAVYQDSTQELRVMQRGERLSVPVEGGGGCDLLTVSPVLETAGVRVAPVGLTRMLNCGGAVLSCRPGTTAGASSTTGTTPASAGAGDGAGGESIAETGPSSERQQDGGGSEPQPALGVTFELEVKGSGPLLVYASQRPSAVVVDDWDRPFAYDPPSKKLSLDLPATGPAQKRVLLRFASAAG